MSKAREWSRGWQMPSPGQCKIYKFPAVARGGGGGGGGGEGGFLGVAGID